jgi:hypothetical protein
MFVPIGSNKNEQESNKNLKAMTWTTKAQLLKYAIGPMTFEEINPTFPLEMGKTTCQRTKRA